MPIYEFECERCGAGFEQLFRSVDEQPRAACPKCGGKKVRRKFSVFGMASRSEGGARRSSGSSCASCRASSCAGCHR